MKLFFSPYVRINSKNSRRLEFKAVGLGADSKFSMRLVIMFVCLASESKGVKRKPNCFPASKLTQRFCLIYQGRQTVLLWPVASFCPNELTIQLQIIWSQLKRALQMRSTHFRFWGRYRYSLRPDGFGLYQLLTCFILTSLKMIKRKFSRNLRKPN